MHLLDLLALCMQDILQRVLSPADLTFRPAGYEAPQRGRLTVPRHPQRAAHQPAHRVKHRSDGELAVQAHLLRKAAPAAAL